MPLQCWQIKVPTVMLMYVGPCKQAGVRCEQTRNDNPTAKACNLLPAVGALLVLRQLGDLADNRFGGGHGGGTVAGATRAEWWACE